VLPNREISTLRIWVCVLSALVVGGTLLATLTPMPYDRRPPSVTFLEGFAYLALDPISPMDIAANLLMFVPVGAAIGAALAAATARKRLVLPATAGLSLLLSVGIEWTQVFIPGRYPSIIDIVSNSIGGLAGAIAASFATTVFNRLHAVVLHRVQSVSPAPPPAESRHAA